MAVFLCVFVYASVLLLIVKAFVNEYGVSLACGTTVLSAHDFLVPTLNGFDYREALRNLSK